MPQEVLDVVCKDVEAVASNLGKFLDLQVGHSCSLLLTDG